MDLKTRHQRVWTVFKCYKILMTYLPLVITVIQKSNKTRDKDAEVSVKIPHQI